MRAPVRFYSQLPSSWNERQVRRQELLESGPAVFRGAVRATPLISEDPVYQLLGMVLYG